MALGGEGDAGEAALPGGGHLVFLDLDVGGVAIHLPILRRKRDSFHTVLSSVEQAMPGGFLAPKMNPSPPTLSNSVSFRFTLLEYGININ